MDTIEQRVGFQKEVPFHISTTASILQVINSSSLSLALRFSKHDLSVLPLLLDILFSFRFILEKKSDSLNSNNLTAVVDTVGLNDAVKIDNEHLENENGEDANQGSRSKRKKKERGQNKKRPRTVPLQKRHERLCPSLSMGESSCDNNNCNYFHDIQDFMKNKPDDIGDKCVNFALKGKCIYGLECRFAKCHVSDDFKNIVNVEKYESMQQSHSKKSGLYKDLQIRLRKKHYQFPKTTEFLQKIGYVQKSTGQHMISQVENRIGLASDEDTVKLNVREKKRVSKA